MIDRPWKRHRREERPSLDVTGTPEAEDAAIWERLYYFGEPNSPTSKATGHRCLPVESQETLVVPTVGMKFPPSVEPVALSQGQHL